jgi:hypothetical protein
MCCCMSVLHDIDMTRDIPRHSHSQERNPAQLRAQKMCTKMHAHCMLRKSHNLQLSHLIFSAPCLACSPPPPHLPVFNMHGRAGAPAPDTTKAAVPAAKLAQASNNTHMYTRTFTEKRERETPLVHRRRGCATCSCHCQQDIKECKQGVRTDDCRTNKPGVRIQSVTQTPSHNTTPCNCITAPPQTRRRSQTRPGPPLAPG